MKATPTARPRSLITGKQMDKIVWGPNWEEILGGEFAKRSKDRNFDDIQKDIYGQFENTFMMYLPRLCEHCLNPACVASCPSGSIYKREEDGIVLIDQDKCRGWRMCVSGCPYKKIYYNWKSGKAEKCIFCYPRIEAGQPTVCSETCVGRIRYLGVLLYDADRIQEAASVEHDRDLYQAQLDIFLDPNDPKVIAQAAHRRHPRQVDGGRAQRARSTRWRCNGRWRCRCIRSTARCRWSGTCRRCRRSAPRPTPGRSAATARSRTSTSCASRSSTWPTCSPPATRRRWCGRWSACWRCAPTSARSTSTSASTPTVLEQVGITQAEVEEMYHVMAIANYEDRFVIPSTHREYAENTFNVRGGCGFSFGNGCSEGTGETSLFGSEKKRTIPIKVEV